MNISHERQELIKLLQKNKDLNRSIIDTCLEALRNEFLTLQASKKMPIGKIRDVYSARAEWARIKQLNVQGYESLLKNLDSEPATDVRLFSIHSSSKVFIIFTVLEMTKLIGILSVERTISQEFL
jgi:hypothetical protein